MTKSFWMRCPVCSSVCESPTGAPGRFGSLHRCSPGGLLSGPENWIIVGEAHRRLAHNLDRCPDGGPVIEPLRGLQGNRNTAMRTCLPTVRGVIVHNIGARTIACVPPGVVDKISTGLPFHSVLDPNRRIPVFGCARKRRMEGGRTDLIENVVGAPGSRQVVRAGCNGCAINLLAILIDIHPLPGKADQDLFLPRPSARSFCYLSMNTTKRGYYWPGKQDESEQHYTSSAGVSSPLELLHKSSPRRNTYVVYLYVLYMKRQKIDIDMPMDRGQRERYLLVAPGEERLTGFFRGGARTLSWPAPCALLADTHRECQACGSALCRRDLCLSLSRAYFRVARKTMMARCRTIASSNTQAIAIKRRWSRLCELRP